MQGKISVGSSAFAIGSYKEKPIPFDEVLKRLSAVGYDGVELFGERPYGHPDNYPTTVSRRELRNKLADLELEVSNYGADFWTIPLGTSDAEARRYE
jgi:sugar phosphate isomerase/epimerase